jgi:SAM-dependent methyltransferase
MVCRAFFSLSLALPGLLAVGCAKEEPAGGLLQLRDFDAVAQRFLIEHPLLVERLSTGNGRQTELQFRDLLEAVAADSQSRLAGAFDYDLPALIRYVIPRPLPPQLTVSLLRDSAEVPCGLALAYARGQGDEYFDRLRRGDPSGLREQLLREVLVRSGFEWATARPEDLLGCFQRINEFLAAEQERLDQGSETSAVHFLDWDLKTTTLTALPFKIGLLTELLLTEVAAEPALLETRRVLVVGPGVDFANPHLGGLAPCALYQPFELLDSLCKLGGELGELRVDCLDVNARVLGVLENARSHGPLGAPLTLSLYSFEAGSRWDFPGVREYLEQLFSSCADLPEFERGPLQVALSPDLVQRAFAEVRVHWQPKIERWSSLPEAEQEHLGRILQRIQREARVQFRQVQLPHQMVARVFSLHGNVITDRFVADNTYDLVLCTNVLNYFPPVLRDLALLNLRRVTKRGGVLLTTEDLQVDPGQVWAGWRLLTQRTHAGWDPQYAYRCVKPE